MKMIYRTITNSITDRFFKGKVICVMGPRQTGKTTLARYIAGNTDVPFLWMNGDEADAADYLTGTTSTRLKSIIGNNKLVIIDEAQKIDNIGTTLKLMVDNFPHVQVLATGSSSFQLANNTNEPLTGRKFEYILYPVSYSEMADHHGLMDERRLLEHRMIYGYYPDVINSAGEETEVLHLLSESYLYRDLFALGMIQRPPLLAKIVQALALQLGNEVSYNELGQLTGADPETVEKYIDLLEKAYVIFRLPSLSRNVRNEIKKGKKFYFLDNGIRNAIIKNFNPPSLRQDTGALWENFLLSERMKLNHYSGKRVNSFFWRTHIQQEIDYIEEEGGILNAFEFKWNTKKKARFPKTFMDAYPNSTATLITRDNYEDFILHYA